jgi:hypothetical protein
MDLSRKKKLVMYGECSCEAVRSYATAQNTVVIPQRVIYKQPQSVALLMLYDKIECFTFFTCKPSIFRSSEPDT